MRKTKKSSSSDSEYCGDEAETADVSPPKLDDGFYEIETIRRKRLRKGEVQYLIKWRGWPETANTWEPLQNLQSVPDLIHAFEESLKSGAKHHRKRKRTTTTLPPHSQTHNTSQQQQHYIPQSQLLIPTPNTSENNLPIHFQQPPISTPHSHPPSDSLQTDRCTGAKKRKSGSVKRFKKEESASQSVDDTMNVISVDGKVEPRWTQTAAGYVGNNNIPDAKTVCNIVKIIKPIGYSASLSSYMQDVSVTFMAMRSDGTEVMVDNKYLKTNNPLLLINFYEQHLRYNPTT